MPGLEMPTRGGGAAMLRELRDEERPAVEERPALQEAEKAQEAESVQTSESYDNMTDNMTNKPTGNQSEQKASSKPNKQARNKTLNKTSQSGSKAGSPETGPPDGLSVAEMIRRRTAQRGEQEVLKTVTLKLSPSLDEKVERYCFDHKMKKQEFWAEAAALYFEMIAEGEG